MQNNQICIKVDEFSLDPNPSILAGLSTGAYIKGFMLDTVDPYLSEFRKILNEDVKEGSEVISVDTLEKLGEVATKASSTEYGYVPPGSPVPIGDSIIKTAMADLSANKKPQDVLDALDGAVTKAKDAAIGQYIKDMDRQYLVYDGFAINEHGNKQEQGEPQIKNPRSVAAIEWLNSSQKSLVEQLFSQTISAPLWAHSMNVLKHHDDLPTHRAFGPHGKVRLEDGKVMLDMYMGFDVVESDSDADDRAEATKGNNSDKVFHPDVVTKITIDLSNVKDLGEISLTGEIPDLKINIASYYPNPKHIIQGFETQSTDDKKDLEDILIQAVNIVYEHTSSKITRDMGVEAGQGVEAEGEHRRKELNKTLAGQLSVFKCLYPDGLECRAIDNLVEKCRSNGFQDGVPFLTDKKDGIDFTKLKGCIDSETKEIIRPTKEDFLYGMKKTSYPKVDQIR